jgi:hypothetical protein
MHYTVSEEVLRATTKCAHDFSCLTSGKCGNPIKCKVNKRFDKNMLYIESAKDKEGVSCPYTTKYLTAAVAGIFAPAPLIIRSIFRMKVMRRDNRLSVLSVCLIPIRYQNTHIVAI